MSTISKETAIEIAYAHREIENSEKLLGEIKEAIRRREEPDIRDAFGRQRKLELGVPSSHNGSRIFGLSWELAEPVITAHIAHQKARLLALSSVARTELDASRDCAIAEEPDSSEGVKSKPANAGESHHGR